MLRQYCVRYNMGKTVEKNNLLAVKRAGKRGKGSSMNDPFFLNDRRTIRWDWSSYRSIRYLTFPHSEYILPM